MSQSPDYVPPKAVFSPTNVRSLPNFSLILYYFTFIYIVILRSTLIGIQQAINTNPELNIE